MSNKRAPVQGYAPGIPWEIHLEAYAAYSKMWAPQPALIDLEGRNCRGGFSTDELDVFVPGWRARVEQFGQMRGALLWLLWHHQGASSIVGLACRRGLGMGQYDHLTDEQVQAAKQWDADGVEGQKR